MAAKPKVKTARNKKIVELYEQGISPTIIARDYDIARQRVYRIIAQMRKKKLSTGR